MKGKLGMLHIHRAEHRAEHEVTVGREDRLVRASVALSLALMAIFAVLASGGVGVVTVLFVALGGYLVFTAVRGWDPLYLRFGIDTRTTAQTDEEDRAGRAQVSFQELRHAGSGSGGHEAL